MLINNFYSDTKYLESQIMLDKGDTIIKTFIPKNTDKYLFIVTKSGFGKKLEIELAVEGWYLATNTGSTSKEIKEGRGKKCLHLQQLS